MPSKTVINIVASAISIAVLCILVTSAVVWMSSDGDYILGAAICNLVAITFAIAGWNGLLDKKKEGGLASPKSWGVWLGMFVLGSVISAVFVLIDCGGHFPAFHPKFICDGHPGISLVFTLGALCMTAIALPSAIRSWIIMKFGENA